MGRKPRNVSGFRAATAVLLAGWYLFATSGAAFLALPLRTKTVVDPSFRCATHACDCRTAEQCAAVCCCFPLDVEMDPGCPMHARELAASEPITVNVTALAAARCAGAADDGTAFPVYRVEPHERCAVPERAGAPSSARWTVAQPRLPSGPYLGGPDKVPISLS
jgi:hypothetical protein